MIVALNKWYGCMMGKLTYEWIWWLGAANGQLLPSEDFQRFQNGVSWAQTCISINLVVLTCILSNWCKNFHCPISQPKYHSNQPRSKYGKEKLSGNCVDNLSSNWLQYQLVLTQRRTRLCLQIFTKFINKYFQCIGNCGRHSWCWRGKVLRTRYKQPGQIT